MKTRALLVSVLLCLTLPVTGLAQETTGEGGEIYYIELLVKKNLSLLRATSEKEVVYLVSCRDTETRVGLNLYALVDAAGNRIEFDNVIGALNYLGHFGWELVATLPIFVPDDPDEAKYPNRHGQVSYLLKFDSSKHPKYFLTEFLEKELLELTAWDSKNKKTVPITIEGLTRE